MAEEKKSFLLYCDTESSVINLSDKEAGQLFKTILAYVNDKNPQVVNKVIKIAFEPIRQQLKRDLIKWRDKKDKKSDSGTLGNLKRWHPDLHEKIIKDEISLDMAKIIAENRKTSHTDKVRSQSVANIAVSDSVSDSVISRGKVLEFLRGAASILISKDEIEGEASKLMKEYQGKKIGNLRALCNKWMNNYQEQQTMPIPEKQMVM